MLKFTYSRGVLPFVLGLITLFISGSLMAQVDPLSILWQRPVGGNLQDEIRDLKRTPDGGCVITGFSKSTDGDVAINKGDDDLLVAKMDAFGNIQWLKTYGGNGQEWGRHIELTSDGGYIIAGHATSLGDYLDVTGNHGGFDYWVVKVGSQGELQWQKTLGGSLLDLGYSVQQTADGGYIAFGGVKSMDGNVTGKTTEDADYWLVRLDVNGNILWQRNIGGSKHEEGSSVEITSDHGFIISGFTDSNDKDATGNHGEDDAYIVKTDSLGNIEWARCYGGSLEDAARAAIETTDGGFVFAGYTNSEDGDVETKHDDQDIWVVKLDTAGNIIWEKAFGGGSLEYAYSIEENIDHTGYLVAGHTGSDGGNITGNHGLYDIWAFEVDLDGKLIWQRAIGGTDNDYGRSITQSANGDYFVAGYTSSYDGEVSGKYAGEDGWVIRLKGDCFNQTYFQDADGDGFGNPSTATNTCILTPGFILNAGDCNDADAAVYPNAAEVCNGHDDDCDALSDEGVQTTYYLDADSDGFGNPSATIAACSIVPSGYTINNTDCNDGSNAVRPTATETCNSIDDNCNGSIDEPMKAYSYTNDLAGIPAGISVNATATNLTRVNGALTISICENGFSSKSFSTGNAFNNALPAVQFTVTPAAGYQLQLSSFTADLRRNSNGPAKVRFAYSINGGSTWIDQGTDFSVNNSACGVGFTSSWDFADFISSQPMIVRMYGYNAAAASGVLQVLNVTLNGTVCLMFDDDHDGYIASLDCNDANPAIHPNAAEKCNGIDENCNTQIDEGVKITFYADADNDGYGNPAVSSPACAAPGGTVQNNEDCNDNNQAIHPGVAEICNGIDEDCDTQIDDGVQTVFYADADNDTYGSPLATTLACSLPSGYVINNIDCNDANTSIHPNAAETCNGLDDNCDAAIDEPVRIYDYVSNTSGVPESISFVSVGSNLKPVNGAGIASGTSACLTGYSVKNFSTATAFSNTLSAVEFTITQNAGYQVNGTSFSVDLRRSGAGPAKVRLAYSTNGGSSWTDEGIDHDLSNALCGNMTSLNWDFADFATGQPVTVRIYGYNASAISGVLQVMNARLTGNICQILDADNDTYNTIVDCNDANATIHPNATEVCNTLDDDCNGQIDEGVKITFYADADNDAYGNNAVTTQACTPPAGYVSFNTDCNDAIATVYPGAPEQCNAIDDDCDTQTDEGASATFYMDADNDLYGNAAVKVVTCPAPPGYVSDHTDCNDNEAAIHPDAAESCNLIDDDCDGVNDDGVQTTFYADNDLDSFGNPAVTTAACIVPAGFVGNNSDCNDANAGIQPNTPETCNGIDDNCNGAYDEAVQVYHYTDNVSGIPATVDAKATASNLSLVNGALTTIQCPTGLSAKNFTSATTFGDTLPAIEFSFLANSGFQLGATSVSAALRRSSSGPTQIRFAYSLDNGNTWIDEGINHSVANAACGTTNNTIWDFDDFITIQTVRFRIYAFNAASTGGVLQLLNVNLDGNICPLADDDGDGYNASIDCDDNNPTTHPGAAEICNGIDDNCNIDIDEGATIIFYADADNDGYGNPSSTTLACNASTGFVADNTDCNDASAVIHPNASEICNGLDENCNAEVDEGAKTTFFADADNDTYGNPLATTLACTLPSGYVTNNADCNDANALIKPGAAEICNYVDDNCNTAIDEEVMIFTYTNSTSGSPSFVSVQATATNLTGVNNAAVTTGCSTGLMLQNFTNASSYNTNLPAVEFTLSPQSGYQVQPSFFSVDLRKNGSGPAFVRFAYSINGGSSWIDQGIDQSVLNGNCAGTTHFTWDINDFSSTVPVKFRIYGFKANSLTGVLQVLNLNINGNVCPITVDADLDGYTNVIDCNDNNSAINPGATEVCNGLDDNCNTQIDEGVKTTFYADADNDTYGNPAIMTDACTKPSGYAANNTDCNDNNAVINPAAAEICNAIDDNCNTLTDEGVSLLCFADADNDGYGNAAVSNSVCVLPSGYVLNSTDCNDSNGAINPAVRETCNTIDDDCDALTDESATIYQFTDNTTGIPAYADLHATITNFAMVNGAISASGCANGFSVKNFTSTTTFSTSLPAIEFTIQPVSGYRTEATSFSAELRRNGGGPSKVRFAYSTNGGSTWIDQGINQALLNKECGVMTPSSWDFADFTATEKIMFRIYGFDASSTTGSLQLLNVNFYGNICQVITDNDGDGYNSTVDCNDLNPAIYPGAAEICNALDDDCDTQIDEGLQATYYADSDHDNFGNAAISTVACAPPSGYVADLTDCNDNNTAVHPGAIEICNTLDDNCDTQVDEGVILTFYADSDNDLYGNSAVSVTGCVAPSGYVSANSDCNDANVAVNPGAAETCNGLDDNCNGTADEATKIYNYTNTNNGVPSSFDIHTTVTNLTCVNTAIVANTCPTGYTTKNYPSTTTFSTSLPAVEFTITPASGYKIDAASFGADIRRSSAGPVSLRFAYSKDGGNSWIDQGINQAAPNSGCGTTITTAWDFTDFSIYQPVKFRIYGFNASGTSGALQLLNVYVLGKVCVIVDADGDGYESAIDCNDINPAVFPGATETCNNTDDNCDGQTDENVKLTFYADADLDTYGNAAVTILACAQGAGIVSNSDDCNDSNAAINPAQAETCNNADDNCDGITDEPIQAYHYTTNTSGIPASYASHAVVTNLLPVNTASVATGSGACLTGISVKGFANSPAFNTALPALQFFITPDAGYQVNASSLSIEGRRNASGPASLRLAYSTDGGNTWTDQGFDLSLSNTDCGIMTSANWDFNDFSAYQQIIFRIYGFNASSTSGILQLLNVNLIGNVCLIPDFDNDGYNALTDCNDANAGIYPNAVEVCNNLDDDCDTEIDEGVKITFFADADNDTYGDAGVTVQACTAPLGYVANNTDCNDANASINPSVVEICNGLDDNCDSQTDENVKSTFYADADNDTFGNPSVTTASCIAPSGYVSNNTDCNDANANIKPTATETCNNVDDNCNGFTDESIKIYNYADNTSGVPFFVSPHSTGTSLTRVNGASSAGTAACATGFSSKFFTTPTIFDTSLPAVEFTITPSAGYSVSAESLTAELRRSSSGPASVRLAYSINGGASWFDQGINQSLANTACGAMTNVSWDFADFSTGSALKFRIYGFNASSTSGILQLLNVTINGKVCTVADADGDGFLAGADCNDNNPAIHPGATELCNTVDDDCDTQIDEGVKITFYADADNDTYGNISVTTQACTAPSGYVANSLDCNDANATVKPSATEICNSVDDDCDTQIDEGVKLTFYADADNDTYGNAAVTTQACTAPSGYVANSLDCNDANASIKPSATEICNTVDDDCDTQIDEGVKITFYADADNDTYGNISVTTQACTVPSGYVANSLDCNDANAAVKPSATEICNTVDDDCDTQIDEGVKITFYADADNDTYGNVAVTTQACTAPSGYVANSLDCNDANAAVKPSATEICNSVDDNCNTQIDEGVKLTFYADADNDTYGNVAVTTQACTAPSGYVSNSTDCNDANAAVKPSATEICNTVDDDCDTQIDEGVKITFYADADNDTYGNVAVTTQACTTPSGYVANSTDCNDANAAVKPSATEICNSVDDNCNTQIDEGVKLTFYADADNDTYGNVAVTTLACSAPSGYVANSTDCNDANTGINPGITEMCNSIDDNCNTQIDESIKVYNYTDNTAGIPLSFASNATAGNLTRVNGAAVPAGSGTCPTGFSTKNFPVTTTFASSLPAIEFTLTPASGFRVEAQSFSANLRRSSGGPASIRFAYSINGGTTWIDQGSNQSVATSVCGTMTAAAWDFNDFSSQQPVKFRVYGFNASATSGVLQLINVTLNGRVCPVTDIDGDGFDVSVDCNDNNPAIHPGATEVCNSTDDNCDTQIDEGVKITFYADADNDTYGNAAVTTQACSAPSGFVANSLDCNDANASIKPSATEICNTVDDDCDTQIDEGVKLTFYADADNDTYGNAAVTTQACTAPNGYVSNSTDCNDANAAVKPSATEICNSVDDNCNTQIDEGVKLTFYADADNDTYGNIAVTTQACTAPSGYVANSTDCNDANASIKPSATEICNTVDDDCDTQIDEGVKITFYADADNDTYGNISVTTQACTAPSGYVANSLDCNDANAAVKPSATEICNTVDDDCDTQIDEGVKLTFYADADNDTYGNIAVTTQACTAPSGYVANSLDCNDANAAVKPSATEICNSVDDDCDTQIDEGVKLTFYADADNDTYGNAAVTTQACSAPNGYVSNSTDCNDANAAVKPSATEICNSVDDDCDTQIDEGVKLTFYADADNDTYGNAAVTTQACTAPSGFVANSLDCNDASAAVKPSAIEICNTVDDDCDTQIDEGVKITFYADADNDTYGNVAVTTQACTAPSGYVANSLDCNDANAAVKPSATEICNSVDDDCDTQIDEGVKLTFYADADNDTYGNVAVTTQACTAPSGYVANSTDCNDANASIKPSATEICNTVDDDCDTQIDEGVKITFYADADNDTYGNAAVTTQACTAPSGYVANSTDCNDANAGINPGITEMCNSIDDNCNTQIDESIKVYNYTDNTAGIPLSFASNATASNLIRINSADVSTTCPSGFSSKNFTPALVFSNTLPAVEFTITPTPGYKIEAASFTAELRRSGSGPASIRFAYSRDNGSTWTDQGANQSLTSKSCGLMTPASWDFADFTATSSLRFRIYGFNASATTGILQLINVTLNGRVCPVTDIDGDGFDVSADCNDNNPAIHPGATEVCNSTDDNCDTQIDEGVKITFYADADNDTYGNAAVTTQACTAPSGYVANSLDCNDANAAVKPSATEICNSVDDDCDTQIDEGVKLTFYADADNDTYGNAAVTTQACTSPSGYVANSFDCNDANAAVKPSATEICNTVDDDCDTQIDEGVKLTFYADADNDTYGNAAVTTQACTAPSGYVANSFDCNDANASVKPSATEICNTVDDDCDTQIDEGVKLTFYADADNDTYGNVAVTTQACTAPSGYVANSLDCNDANAAVKPSATEICNTVDDDCDTQIDEGVKLTFYADADNDSYGDVAVTTQACTAPSGYVTNSLDCNDANAAVKPSATEICNSVDDNCNTQIDEGVKITFYADADNDTYGNVAVTTLACNVPYGYVANSLDCNDADASIKPSATEICNSVDDDCNTQIDDGVKITFYADADNDTFGDVAVTTQACTAPSGFVANSLDCNDANAAVKPSATEICNTVDDDCDTQIDEGVKLTFYADADNDTYGNAAVTTQACNMPYGYVANSLDCNDADASIKPLATEICNSVDDDCDTQIDEGVKITFYADADNDTYGDVAVTTLACNVPYGYVANSLDCNDADASIKPSATEICNSVDDDCNTQIDDGVKITFYADADNDTYGNVTVTTQACSAPSGYVANSTDCNDANAGINPGITEMCNSIDDNCDTQIDEGVKFTFYADADNDTYGDVAVTTLACNVPYGYVANSLDCNDADASIKPSATEICNSVDDDCNTQIDDGVKITFYADADNDTFGDVAVTTQACNVPYGYVANSSDCNDANASIKPSATEICNSVDDNCDTQIDEGVKLTFYADADNDTYGNVAVTTQACSAPSGYVANSTDCNDANAGINPGITEMCNSIDDNCDTQIDEGVKLTFYADADNDTYGNVAVTTQACSAPSGYVANSTDCNDANAGINPGITEMCNSIDDNCDTQIDEGVKFTFYADADNDTYGDVAVTTLACNVPYGYVANSLDCNDADASIKPSATEICNSVDDDCNTQIDDDVKITFYADADNDTFGDVAVTTQACNVPYGYASNSLDCNDADASIKPSASEICNSVDDNCNGETDEPIQLFVYTDDISGSPQFVAAQSTAGNLIFVNGAGIATGCPTGFSAKNFPSNTVFSTAYPGIEFTITPQTGYVVAAGSFSAALRRNGIGPANVRFAYTVDGGNTWVDQGTDISLENTDCGLTTNANWDFGNFSSAQPVTFRIYGFNASSGTGVLQVLNITLSGNICPATDADNDGYDVFFDCDDHNNMINPGLQDICNGIDDNCNTLIDEDVHVFHYTDNISGIPQSVTQHATGSNLSLVNNSILAPGCPTGFSSKDYTAATVFDTTLPAVQFTITSEAGFQLEAGSLSADVRRNGIGPASLRFAFSTDNGSSWIDNSSDYSVSNSDCGITTPILWDFADFTTTQTLVCRIYGFNASSTGGVLQLLNVNFNGKVCPLPDNDLDGFNSAVDCDDNNFNVNPDATELCNGIDDDCDMVTDENSIAAGITPLGSLDICGTGSVELQADAGAGYTYQWYRNDSIVAGATGQNYTATITGAYSVLITNQSNCSNTSPVTAVIYNCRLNDDTEHFGNATLYLYPNPSSGNFVVEIRDAETEVGLNSGNNLCNIWVTNAFGQSVYSESVPITDNLLKKEIILPDAIAAGCYIVHIIIKNERDEAHSLQWNSRLIIQQ
ncbi:MAG: putative metal-binding motif-containing protein [Chitinophagales bacterium]|nr:putative metal-binding motif-containing protein [Chitinophagales bacterium]